MGSRRTVPAGGPWLPGRGGARVESTAAPGPGAACSRRPRERATRRRPLSYDTIYLSPHLDDAVLSCGGRIASACARGERVLVVTLAAGDPPATELTPLARSLHATWGAGRELSALRRAEDRAASARLGADVLHWDVPDSLYRRTPDGRPLCASLRSLFAPPLVAETALEEECRRRLADLPPHGLLVAPLAVGGHINHRLARRVAERSPQAARGGAAFYEDFPYVLRWRALAKALGRQADWAPDVLALEEPAVAAKLEAIAAYATQVPSLFPGAGRLEKDVRTWARKVGGERIWRRAAP